MAASVYIGRTAPHIFDRGRAEFFHGRRTILGRFEKVCDGAIAVNGGTTFLVHGAPGAGKTALLNECADAAARNGWLVAPSMVPLALADEERMKDAMAELFTLQIKDGITLRKDVPQRAEGNTPSKVLAHGNRPLLLVIDEAQNLRNLSDRSIADIKVVASETLYKIHNGKLRRPVMLLAAGLSDTPNVFAGLGIFRFEEECDNALGVLSNDDARSVIHDWLFYRGDVSEDATKWVDAIAQETHGWPQHIIAYMLPALERLSLDGREMTPQGLAKVLEEGRLGRESYYRERTSTFDADELTALVDALQAAGPGDHIPKLSIMQSLLATYPHQEANRLFNLAVHKGVLSKDQKHYAVPVPSMRSWLDREYGSPELDPERSGPNGRGTRRLRRDPEGPGLGR